MRPVCSSFDVITKDQRWRMGVKETEREKGEKGSTTYPPYFPLQRLSLPPIETKPQVLPYFPSVFPLLSCKSFLRECSPITHSTNRLLRSFPFFLSLLSPDVYAETTYLHIIFSMDFTFFICSHRTRPLICIVETKRCHE